MSKDNKENRKTKVLGFYGHARDKPYGCFSNFHEQAPYTFRLPASVQAEGLPVDVECRFAEKAIMACKAALFGDAEMFQAIAEAPTPAKAKALGRAVRGFEEEAWARVLPEVAREVVLQKMRADPDAAAELTERTGNHIIAEAAPNDTVWGIGLATDDPRVQTPAEWRGRNVLGTALMEVRKILREEQQTSGPEVLEVKPGKKKRWGSL